MRYYIVELKDNNPRLQSDFSLLLYRLGQKLRLELRTHRLPEPFVSTEPGTGRALGRFYLQTDDQPRDRQLQHLCRRFEDEFARDVSCRVQATNDWPPATRALL